MRDRAVDEVLGEVIAEYVDCPVDMLGIGDALGELAYLNSLRDSYARTVNDVISLAGGSKNGKQVLELGSFLGAVSITLKRLGCRVSAADIPEFQSSDSLRKLYSRNGISFDGVNLRHAKLPFESESMDVVILCEVLEHLNFNPLPALQEIHRVLNQGGHLYLAMPNQANIINRMRLLSGHSIHNPISDFSAQLDRNSNMIVGLHWREYTMLETRQLIETMGFEVVTQKYYANRGSSAGPLVRLFRGILYAWPAFRPSLVVIARKVDCPAHDFNLVEANS